MMNTKWLFFIGLFLLHFRTDGQEKCRIFEWNHYDPGISKLGNIVTDLNNNTYLAGSYRESITLGSQTVRSGGEWASFIAKIDPKGQCVWIRSIENPAIPLAFNHAQDIDIDRDGNIYVTGIANKGATFGIEYIPSNTGFLYVSKLNADGLFLWTSILSGSFSKASICTAPDGRSYIGTNFMSNITINNITYTPTVFSDALVACFQPDGRIEWGTVAPSGNSTQIHDIARNTQTGHLYIAGNFGESIICGQDTLRTLPNSPSMFVARISNTGIFVWARQAGNTYGPGNIATSVATSGNADVYVTGTAHNNLRLGNFTLTPAIGSSSYTYMAQLNSWGDFVNAIKIAPLTIPHYIYPYRLVMDKSEQLYLTASFSGTLSLGNYTLQSNTQSLLIARFAPNLQSEWARVIINKNNGSDSQSALSFDRDNNPIVAGHFIDSLILDNDTLVSNKGEERVWIAKLSPINKTTVLSSGTLNAVQDNVNYQWVYCPGYLPVPGATQQAFTPSASGSYAVLLSNNFCNDTSACIDVIITAIDGAHSTDNVRLYPNPVSQILHLDRLPLHTTIRILDITGKIRYQESSSSSQHRLLLTDLTTGIYTLQLLHNGFSSYHKIVKTE